MNYNVFYINDLHSIETAVIKIYFPSKRLRVKSRLLTEYADSNFISVAMDY